MGLDYDNPVHLGIHCGQNIHHDSSHSDLWRQTLVQEIPNHLYRASIHRGDCPHCCCLGTVPSGPRALEPDHISEPLGFSNSTGSGLLASMSDPSIPETCFHSKALTVRSHVHI